MLWRILLFLIAFNLVHTYGWTQRRPDLSDQLQLVQSVDVLKKLKTLSTVLDRSLDLGYSQHFLTSVREESVVAISKDGQLLAMRLYQKNAIGPSEKDYLLDPAGLTSYLHWHNEHYDVQLSWKHFREALLAAHFYTLGCGFSGQLTDHGQQMKRAILRQDRKTLNQFLRSPNPELQAYGAFGMLQAAMYPDFTLTTSEKRILEHLKKRNTLVINCQGCFAGLQTAFGDLIEP